MLLNFKDTVIRAAFRPLFQADCRKIAEGDFPQRAWETDIYVTRRCNMNCSYCYVKEYFDRDYPFTDPTLEQIKTLLERIALHTYGLVVLGGEPLVRKDLHDILKTARDAGVPSVRIASNGTLIKRQIDALRYLERLNISLDATRKREFPALVEKMLIDVPEVKRLMGEDFPAVCVSYTLAPEDDFEKDILPIIGYAKDNGFDIKFLPCKYPNKEVNWNQLKEVMGEAEKHISGDRILNIRPLTQQITHEFLFQNCLQGMQYYIDFDGQFLYPCDEYPSHRIGSIYEHSIPELFRMGREKFGTYPDKSSRTCTRCKSYCHAENSFNYRYPERQLTFF